MPRSTTKNPPLFTKVRFKTDEEAHILRTKWAETDVVESVDNGDFGESIYNASTGEWIYANYASDNYSYGYLKNS